MTELNWFIWQAVVVVVAVLVFLRTKPAPPMHLGSVLDVELDKKRFERLEKEVNDLHATMASNEIHSGAVASKAVVDRINALSTDMLAVKPRLLECETTLGELVISVGRLKTASAMKTLAKVGD